MGKFAFVTFRPVSHKLAFADRLWRSYLLQPAPAVWPCEMFKRLKEILLIIWYKVDHGQILNRSGILWKPASQFHKQLQSRGIFDQLWMEAAEAD